MTSKTNWHRLQTLQIFSGTTDGYISSSKICLLQSLNPLALFLRYSNRWQNLPAEAAALKKWPSICSYWTSSNLEVTIPNMSPEQSFLLFWDGKPCSMSPLFRPVRLSNWPLPTFWTVILAKLLWNLSRTSREWAIVCLIFCLGSGSCYRQRVCVSATTQKIAMHSRVSLWYTLLNLMLLYFILWQGSMWSG